MPLIQVIKDNKEFHLETWNESALIELGINYEIIPIGDRFYLLYTMEQLQSLIEPN
jgi:hypothetical protein